MGRIAAVLATIIALKAGQVSAETGFQQMTGEEIRAVLTDARVDFSGKDLGVWQVFHADGRTLYKEGEGGSWGRWHVLGGQYCSTWPPSAHVSCFDMARSGNTIRFTGARGNTYEGRVK